MIPKFLTPWKLPKAGPSLKRDKSLGDPRTNLTFLGLLRSAQARYLEAIMESAGAVCTRLTTEIDHFQTNIQYRGLGEANAFSPFGGRGGTSLHEN